CSRTTFDPAALASEIERLREGMQRPRVLDDAETAARVSAQHAAPQRRLETFRSLESDVSDLDELVELSADDPELASELESQLVSIEGRLEQLEEARLFNGEYDAGDAVVTVRSGAGGTDSQDWAEMLLRMYLRWAERRGVSPARGAGCEG